MISENAFDEKDKDLLDQTHPFKSEMASPSEWIVREDAHPDDLLIVFVAPTGDGKTLQAACSCPNGTRDLKCLHALDVFQNVRANEEILVQLLKRRQHYAIA